MEAVNVIGIRHHRDMQYLCIMVNPDDEDGMRIPETGAYTAMGDYEGAIDNGGV